MLNPQFSALDYSALALFLPSSSDSHPVTHTDLFYRLLDESASLIAHPGALALPGDELHAEILIPLLPLMLRDQAIREAWSTRRADGYFSLFKMCCQFPDQIPAWEAADFEIPVTSSHLAGPDAKALADTLLSEGGLRELAASLMNQILPFAAARLPQTAQMPSISSTREIQPAWAMRDFFHSHLPPWRSADPLSGICLAAHRLRHLRKLHIFAESEDAFLQ